MTSPPQALRTARWVLLALGVWACHGSGPPQGAPAATGKRYTVRAEVVTVPARPGGELVLRHEAIPDFADKTGAVVGMGSMVMPFPVPASLSLAGLAPGDKIQFVFSVDWAQGKYAIERFDKLPAETALKLGPAPVKGAEASRVSEPIGR